MEILYTLVLKSHMVAGLLALPIFWLPALARKGSPVHRRAGRWFMLLMSIVAITGIPLTIRFFYSGQWIAATFLGYLLVITVTAIATAWFALKLKQDAPKYFGTWYRALALLNLIAGSLVLYLGISRDVTLFVIFAFIGLFAGIDMFNKAFRPTKREANWWLHEHLGGMIGAGIAAHVAFGAFGLRRLWPEYGSFDGLVGMLPWIVPPVVGIAASIYSSKKYRTKMPDTGTQASS